MLYLSNPQPYGSGLLLKVNRYSRNPSFLSPDLRTLTPAQQA
jgi:hypothetical protein